MTQPTSRAGGDGSPVLSATAAAGASTGGNVPSARAIGRVFPLGDDDERILLGVADGIGDPPSAEAQAAEALARLQRTVARAPQGTQPAGVLEAAYADADEAIERLNRQPGSVPGSGAALVAAIVSDGTATIAHLGRGAAFLRRGGIVRRLTSDHRWGPATADEAASGLAADPEATQELGTRAPLGGGGPVAPEIAAPVPLQPGDTLLLCSEAVVLRLGAKVLGAVLEEYTGEEAAQEIAGLTAQQEAVAGAAVALLHLPGVMASVAAAGAASLAAPLASDRRQRRRLAPTVGVLVSAIAVGALLAGTIYVAATRGDSARPSPTASVLARLPAASPGASPALQAATLSPTPRSMTTAPTPARTRTGTPNAAGNRTAGSSPAPIVVARLSACDSGQPPCRYRAQPGDSLSVIGDRFSLSRTCFEAANRTHLPLPPRAPDYRIGVGEEYAILDPAGCAALVVETPAAGPAGTPATAPSAAPVATGSPAARGACTPRPGATAANPLC